MINDYTEIVYNHFNIEKSINNLCRKTKIKTRFFSLLIFLLWIQSMYFINNFASIVLFSWLRTKLKAFKSIDLCPKAFEYKLFQIYSVGYLILMFNEIPLSQTINHCSFVLHWKFEYNNRIKKSKEYYLIVWIF